MGMFDDVLCEYPLPDGHEGSLQTKDMDCTLTDHKITVDGRLLRRDYEWVDNDKAPLGFWREPRGWTDTQFHGILNFYGGDDGGIWHEYNAKFTDGQLVEIVVVADRRPA